MGIGVCCGLEEIRACVGFHSQGGEEEVLNDPFGDWKEVELEEFFHHLFSVWLFPEVTVTDHIIYEGNVVLHSSFDLVLHSL